MSLQPQQGDALPTDLELKFGYSFDCFRSPLLLAGKYLLRGSLSSCRHQCQHVGSTSRVLPPVWWLPTQPPHGAASLDSIVKFSARPHDSSPWNPSTGFAST